MVFFSCRPHERLEADTLGVLLESRVSFFFFFLFLFFLVLVSERCSFEEVGVVDDDHGSNEDAVVKRNGLKKPI